MTRHPVQLSPSRPRSTLHGVRRRDRGAAYARMPFATQQNVKRYAGEKEKTRGEGGAEVDGRTRLKK